MTHQSFPSPPPLPLQRLHVYDSLMMNAERWQKAQQYHRQRQNVHYQSLNEPGIVYGLGVRVITAPAEAAAKFSDRRWLEIQPGIAIDLEGNPIVVDPSTDRTFRIATPAPTTGSITVYLVVSYVEPQNPKHKQGSDLIREWFRFDEKTSPPTEKEIELCRIRLQPATVELETPTDVLFPSYNQLDLRSRQKAKARPQTVVQIATILNVSDRTHENLSYLMQSIGNLYASLHGTSEIAQVDLHSQIPNYDLLYVTGWQALNLDTKELDTLIKYLLTGGVIFIEVPQNSRLLVEDIKKLITFQLEISLQSWQELIRNHPLRTQPFLFAALPQINHQQIQLWNGGGIVLVEGDLSGAWGLDENLSLERNDIRTAQELAINVLDFASHRRQIYACLQ
ncbi:DUF4159 domain-containing protein [Nostoc sp. NMS9]|uniref:DUF4159 domain-containing protein n=1 Tax=Nostoc sp. NMS9 TaxID=2815393 RepID=UPI0025EF1CF2|nr:DUF4159 domain-containing protein [Nostoc sp. NMS9]MBN3941578.1 DUF4159 domain-containing protein [Nostoc sp. NMS9]